MTSRITSAAVGVPLLIIVIWTGAPWLSLLVAALAALGSLEICDMARQRGRHPITPVAAAWSVTLVGGAHFLASGYSLQATLPPVAGALGLGLASAVGLLWRSRTGVRLVDLGVIAGAALYTGGLLSYAPLLRGLGQGREWLLFAVFVTFAADTSAYLVGRSLGKTPMAPSVSPGKTWEGAAGGLMGALVVSVASNLVLGLNATLSATLLLGALMGVVGQAGDLAESRLKRAAGVKDSGSLIPGHGGVLDRLDSIVFNLVLVYYFAIWVLR